MKCVTCNHESSAYDFVTLRNLCEHLYLDAIFRKADSASSGFEGLKKDCSRNTPSFVIRHN